MGRIERWSPSHAHFCTPPKSRWNASLPLLIGMKSHFYPSTNKRHYIGEGYGSQIIYLPLPFPLYSLSPFHPYHLQSLSM